VSTTETAILFDLDGTLTDPREGIVRSLRHAFSTIGWPVPSDHELERWIGPPLHQAFGQHFGQAHAALVEPSVAAYRERFGSVGLYENVLYAGIAAGLAELAEKRRRLFVVTSKPTPFAARILEHFDLLQCFEAVHGSELSGERSDKTELIAHVLRVNRLSAERAIMVGDREHDVIGARQNGVIALGVLWGYGSEQELLAAGARETFAEPAQLFAALRQTDRPSLAWA
jgi:phosphoglycolate phosphatase